jgi:hypothetical protein
MAGDPGHIANLQVRPEQRRPPDKMPIVSKAQQRWMFANKPEMAERWAKETPDIKALPEKVKKPRKYYGEK